MFGLWCWWLWFFLCLHAGGGPSIGDDDGSDTLVFQSLSVFGILYRREESQEKSLDLSKPGKTNQEMAGIVKEERIACSNEAQGGNYETEECYSRKQNKTAMVSPLA